MKIVSLLLVLFTLPSVAAIKSKCVSYEPTVETLRGRIARKTFAGPPNYESVCKGDLPETYWILNLDSPVCVKGDSAADSINGDQEGVTAVQLVFMDRALYKRYSSLVNKRVSATGTLFSAHTAHHHRPLLMTVSSLEPRAK